MSEHVQSGLSCLVCPSSDAMSEYDDHYYCFSCKAYIKKSNYSPISYKKRNRDEIDYPEEAIFNPRKFPLDACKWLYENRIFDHLIEEYKIFYLPDSHRVGIPTLTRQGELLNYQTRRLNDDDNSPKYLGRGSKNLFHSRFTKTNYCVIVEDMLSAIRVGELCSCVALCGTSLPRTKIWDIVDLFKAAIIWLDGDAPGIKAASKIEHQLSLYMPCKIIRSTEDPKTYSKKEIRGILGL